MQSARIAQLTRSAQLTSFLGVASCGLLPRTTRPGPRLRTAFWSVAILPLRDTNSSSRVADALDLSRILYARVLDLVANPSPASPGTWSAPRWTTWHRPQEPWPPPPPADA